MKYSIFLSAILITWMGVYTPTLSFSWKKESQQVQYATAVCKNAVITLDTDGQTTLSPSDIDDGSTGFGDLSYAISDTAFDCENIGSQIVTLTVSDSTSTTTCTATVTILDNTPPEAKCKNIVLQLDETGEALIAPSDVNDGSSDACGIMNISLDRDDFTCTNVSSFSKIVNLSVMDSSQNIDGCQALVQVEDNLPPVIACQNITVELNAVGGASLVPSDITSVASDACGISSLTIDRDSFTCNDISQFSKIVNLQAVDIHGNDSSCQALVMVMDERNPDAICQDITVFLDAAGEYALTASEIDNGSSDNCGIATQAISVSSFACANTLAAVPVKLRLADINGNRDSCDALVTVLDTLSPKAVCQDVTVYLDNNGSYSLTSSEIENGSSDNCGIDLISIPPSIFDCSTSAAMVRLGVTDIHGNKDSCMAQVMVKDTIAPHAQCQPLTIYLDQVGNYTLAASDFNNFSDDNCGISPLIMAIDSVDFDCTHIGSHTVTLTVTDASNNTASCQENVAVIDSVSPQATCQNLTVQLDSMGIAAIMSSDLDNGSSDACGLLNLSASKYNFDCTDLQNSSQTLTLTVTDVNNNVQSCQAVVLIQDTIGPVVTCSNITLYLDVLGEANIVALDVGTASDNCELKDIGISQNNFNCNHLGSNTISFAAEDSSTNLGLCSPQVEVKDTLSPILTCPLDEVVTANSNCQARLADFTTKVSPTDNCTATPMVSQFPLVNTLLADTSIITLTAADGSNNTTSCTFKFIVIDETTPTVTCKDIIVELDSSGLATITPDDVTDTKMDNCTAVNDLRMSLSRTLLECSDVKDGPTLVLTAIDESDNTDSCLARISVRDNIAPIVTCADSMEVALGLIDPVLANLTLADNCRVEDVSYPFNQFNCNQVATYVPITFLVEDPSGNITPCTTIVYVKDSAEVKWISRPPNIVRCGEQLIDWAEPTASFPCERAPVVSYLTQPEGLMKGGAFPIGNTQVLYQLEDVLVEKSLAYDFNIEILPIPIITNYANGDEFIATSLEDFELLPEADIGGVSYLWELQLSEFLEATPPLPTELTAGPLLQTFSFTDARSVGEALYKITPVFADSCVGEPVQILVKVLPGKGTFFVPEMFTPNGDGINDDWGARLLTDGNPDDYRITVFNQAGGKMYNSISLNNRWNGGNCPDGPYWYIIERKSNGERVKTGGVTIQR